MSTLSLLVVSLQAVPGNLVDIATQGPIPAILLVFGALFLAVSLGVFGILTFAALAKLFNPTSASTPRPPAE